MKNERRIAFDVPDTEFKQFKCSGCFALSKSCFDKSGVEHWKGNEVCGRWAEEPMTPTFYEISELPSLGWITITSIGEENIYFTLGDGSRGFCKP